MTTATQHTLQLVAGIIGCIAYVPLIVGIVTNKVRQSFAAFLLWAMLDAIATATTVLQHGNFWLPLSNVVGASTIAILLAVKKQIAWSWIETLTGVLVVICVIIWSVSGEQAGIVASSLAVVIASIPQMVDTYKRPRDTPAVVYLIFFAANTLSFFAGKAWTIEERFYAACSMFLCLVIVILSRTRMPSR